MILRPALATDAALLRAWDRQAHVIAATGDDEAEDWDTVLSLPSPYSAILLAEVDGRAIGALRIIDPANEETHYWGKVPQNLRALDIWIGEACDLGRGHGTRMMQLALQHCFATPTVTAVLIDPLASNVRAHRFYERLGFRFVERRRFATDDCFVYQLDRDDWAARQAARNQD